MHLFCPVFSGEGKRTVSFPYKFLCTTRNRVNNELKNVGRIEVVNYVTPCMAKQLKIQKPLRISAGQTSSRQLNNSSLQLAKQAKQR